ncbi:hypothetical protein QBC39DRAFT_342950 [Podospora conica]|nr:hypothetical protein QBC39DRAFT_342950 [Schizothecium conicum]
MEQLNEKVHKSHLTCSYVSRVLRPGQVRWPTVFVQRRLYWMGSLGIRSPLCTRILTPNLAHTRHHPLPECQSARLYSQRAGGISITGPVSMTKGQYRLDVRTRRSQRHLQHGRASRVRTSQKCSFGPPWGCCVATSGPDTHHPRNNFGRLPCHASIAHLVHLSRRRATLLASYWFPGHARPRQVPTIHHTFLSFFTSLCGSLSCAQDASTPTASQTLSVLRAVAPNRRAGPAPTRGHRKLIRSSGDADCRMNAAAVRVWWFSGLHHNRTPTFIIRVP